MAEPTPRRYRWILPLVVLGIAVGGTIVYARFQNAALVQAAAVQRQKAAVPAVPVTSGRVTKGDFPVYIEGLGTVQAFNIVTVRSRVDGELIKLAAREGQMVKEGDLLALIDARPFQATLGQAQAKKVQDQANLKNAGLDLQRYATLAKQSFATGQQLDTQKATVSQLTAQLASDQAAIDNAQTQLSYATIKAPLNGRVGFKLVDQGNLIRAGDAGGIATIAQLQPISVVFTAPENEVSRINKAMAGGRLKTLALSSGRDQQLAEGELSVLNNTVDQTSGTIQLKATFANTDNALWPGLAVTTRLLVSTERNVVILPVDAIQHGPHGLYVFLIGNDNKVQSKDIKIGQQGDTQAVVVQGLSGGERVVVAGQYKLQDGTPVNATDETPQQTASEVR